MPFEQESFTQSSERESSARSIASYAVFPVVFGGIMTTAIALLERGRDPAAVAAGLTGIGVVLLLALERVHPYRAAWRRSHHDIGTDLVHNAVNFAARELFNLATVGGFVAAGAWLSNTLGATLWPASWPLIAQLVLALVVGEFGTYWIHRLMHETELLWRIHATHHSSPRLYWLNAGRFHPIDLVLQHALGMAPLILLGAGGPVIALHALFTAVHGLFQHANIAMKLGPLNWFFSMAELHRWHHSKEVSEANHNYGANIILWDIVFGTRFLPKDREPPIDTGIGSLPDFPQRYLAQLASPFRWR